MLFVLSLVGLLLSCLVRGVTQATRGIRDKLLQVFATLACTYLSTLSGAASPTCYSCDGLENPADCTNTATCATDQVCSVQETFGIHGAVNFWSGCEDISTCSEMSINPFIGKKRDLGTPDHGRCLYCCTTNLCNNNCSGFVNLALHRPAYQSSVDFNGSANLAVDGNKDPNYFHGSCIHTKAELFSWWAVDLGKNVSITAIKIYNRNDAGADGRFVHLKILVSSQNATVLPRESLLFQECGNYVGHSSDGNIITIKCPGKTIGRWVRIQAVLGPVEYFHFCEVEVFGY